MSQDKSAIDSTTKVKVEYRGPLELLHSLFTFLDPLSLASAKNVSWFWYHEAKAVAKRECKKWIPEHLLNQVADPIRVTQRLRQLMDCRFIIFYPGNVHYSRNILRDIRQSGLLHHVLCYPYVDEQLNVLAKNVFQEKLLSREILMRVKNVPGIEFMLEASKERMDGMIYEEISYKTNDARIIRRALALGNPEEIVRKVEEQNYANSLMDPENYPPEFRDRLRPKDPCQEHSGYEKLEKAAVHACDRSVFDAIMSAFPWDRLQLVNTILTQCVTKCYVESPLIADAIYLGWREFDHDVIDQGRLLEKLSEASLDKYFLMYAILISGKVSLIDMLLNFLIHENELSFYPDFLLGGLLIFLIKHHRIHEAKKLQEAISATIDNREDIIEVIENPTYFPPVELNPIPILNQQAREVGMDAWSGILKQFSLAIFRTILLHKCDEFHYLLVDIMSIDNSQLVNYFMQSVVMERLPLCRTLALDCNINDANIPDLIDENTTSPYRALQHIVAWSGDYALISLLYSREPTVPQPELFDLDVVVSGGCVKGVDTLLAINSSLKLEKIHLDIAAAYGHIELFEHLIVLDPLLKPNEVTCKFAMVNLQVPMMQHLLERYPDLTPQETIFNPPELDDGSDEEEEESIVADAQNHLGMNTEEELNTIRRICKLGKLDRVTLFKHTSYFTRDEMQDLIQGFQQKISHTPCRADI